jgi:hypothetical protein
MNDTKPASAPLPGAQPDRMFPRLTPEQMARVAVHGQMRRVKPVRCLSRRARNIPVSLLLKKVR